MIPRYALRMVCGNPIVSPLELVPDAVWYILLAVLTAAAITAVVLIARKRAGKKNAGKPKESEETDNE